MAALNLFMNCESVEEVHNILMTSLCCDYLDAESQKSKFQKFKLKSFLHLTTPNQQNVSNPHDIWKLLECKGLLGQDNYTVLKTLVKDLDADMTHMIEDAEDRIQKLKGEDVPVRKRQRKVKDEDTDIKTLKEKLCKENNYEAQKVRVSPLQPTSTLPIEDIFVPISIREDLEYKGKGRKIGMKDKRTKPVNNPRDMFYIDGDMARNIFILGDAGIGKSTFCLKLVDNWCKAQNLIVDDTSSTGTGDNSVSWVSGLKIFDFLFFIQLRHVDKSRSSVIDMIVNDVFHTHPSCHDVIRRVLFSERYKSLIVIDGIDEWKIPDKVRSALKIEGLPNTENIVNSTFLWSMRPWIMEKYSDMIRGNDRVVEIQGLDEDSKDSIIEKMLVNFYELDKKSSRYKEKAEAIKEKSHEQSVQTIMKIPLMAVACIQIWYEEKEVGNSMTSLYIALLDLLIRRSNKKAPLPDEIRETLRNKNAAYMNLPQAFHQNKNINEFTSVIMKLGRIAYNDLVSDKTHLVFRVEDLEKDLEKYELDIALKIGLLSKCEAPGSCNKENISINFFHKSIQEFLAALYTENYGQVHNFFRHLSCLDVIIELGNVLIFLSGLNPMLGSYVSKHIVDVANADTRICKYRKIDDASIFIFYISEVELLYKLQISCYKEITHTKLGIHDTKQIPFHASDLYVFGHYGKDTIGNSADILKHHNADIRSLHLAEVPTENENGIPDCVLTQYLDHAVSLKTLYLNGFNTNRTLRNISDIFSSLTALVLEHITLSSKAISTLQSALQSNTVIQTLGLVDIKCQVNEDEGHKAASLSGIIQILPD